MELEVEGRCGAGYDEKSAERLNSRNGYPDRSWDTRADSVELKIPKLRQGSYFPRVPGASAHRREGAHGRDPGSLRAGHLHPLGGRAGQGAGDGRCLQEPGQPPVRRARRTGRSLLEPPNLGRLAIPVDRRNLRVKTREAGRIVSVAVIVAVGVNTNGQREVLGLKIEHSEAEPFWTEFLRSLNRRGLRGVRLVISDSHEGIKAAIAKVFEATWQRCRVHFMRNALAHAGKTQRRMVSAAIGTVFVQESADAAREQWRSVADQLRGKFPKLGMSRRG
jgi:putative transposase